MPRGQSLLSERIVDALADAGFISDDLVTSPDRFDDIVAVVDAVMIARLEEHTGVKLTGQAAVRGTGGVI